jgi:hypothetical protein
VADPLRLRMKRTSKRRSLRRTILWVGATLGFGLFIAFAAIATNTSDRFYVLSGTARISSDAVVAARTPAVVCVGNGGPFGASGVSAHALGFDGTPPAARVICRVPSTTLTMPYSTDVISSYQPRRMHGYVWLEQHAELAAQCEARSEAVIDIPEESLTGYRSDTPAEWPCFHPRPHASLGYAVAFQSFFSNDTETATIDVVPDGYAQRSSPTP